MHDLVIRGGTVVDGTGADARPADVAIDGGRITQVGGAVGCLLWASPALAQGGWPTYPLPGPHSITRGPGSYLSWWKLLLLWLLFLAWAKIVDWVSHDCQEHQLVTLGCRRWRNARIDLGASHVATRP